MADAVPPGAVTAAAKFIHDEECNDGRQVHPR